MIRFSWDSQKARTNLRKHGISFEAARRVFYDPFHLTEHERIEGGERPWQTIGTIEVVVVGRVANSDEVEEESADEAMRSSSARRATKRERNSDYAHSYNS